MEQVGHFKPNSAPPDRWNRSVILSSIVHHWSMKQVGHFELYSAPPIDGTERSFWALKCILENDLFMFNASEHEIVFFLDTI